MFILLIQVYLITGGSSGGTSDPPSLTSTETLIEDASAWITLAGQLPRGLGALKGVSLNNNILMTGKIAICHLLFLIFLILQEDLIRILLIKLKIVELTMTTS